MNPKMPRPVTLLLCLPLLGLTATACRGEEETDRATRAPFLNQIQIDESEPLRSGPNAGYAPIVEKVTPSVVSVASARMLRGYARDFWTGRVYRQERSEPQGLGSGVILTPDGYIVTNHHVVAGADQIIVTLRDSPVEHPARLLGADPATDLALLKIEADDLPAATLGRSQDLKQGDFVLAIGSPFGLDHTVTSGIVSALGRTRLGILNRGQGYENFIQTDAAINPGNSGGALIDNQGRIVGINTAIFSRTGGSVGIGFAIPSEMVLDVIPSLAEEGRMLRGYLGVYMADMDEEFARQLQAPIEGVLIRGVVRESPAFESGLRPGDIILRADGIEIASLAELRLLLGRKRPGEEVALSIRRQGRPMDIVVRTDRPPENPRR